MNKAKDKALVVAPRIWRSSKNYNNSIEEISLLITTLGLDVAGVVEQKINKINPAYFIGTGKAKQIIEQAKMLNAQYIIFDEDLSPVQTKNFQQLNKQLKILDRPGVILEIFFRNAKSKESKTQVELARLQYQLPRLTRLWTHLERQMGGFGTRAGAGETQIEVDRRIIRKKISLLKKKLKNIDSERRVQSKKRKSFFRASFVGYTNVGKSSLMKSLTKSDVLIKDQLFATLDTTVRRLFVGNNNHVLLSDTVGFIRNLPDNLIASFKSTLQEVVDSNLLLVVLDANSKDLFNEIETIQSVLKEIKANEVDTQYVFNKVDLVDGDRISYLKQSFPEAIMVSATRALQLSSIIDLISAKHKNWISALKNP
tara:strand:- start:1801 stop:2907 length:1107 start_codon:yes stop_codon:yes gene_type:complete